ncbi:hypothetical protein [Streptomyces jumonjinensis]|uniref:ATP-binding protein n=1 Tax=Streptomyces jumonjinensis TaxID=1945 RepID=A0A646KES1_STRJU|nr:hypothetical protein [Streptomyces jumonjinensis]MQT00694.1 hypothetical protein [Streptomyces jumonjinensis]
MARHSAHQSRRIALRAGLTVAAAAAALGASGTAHAAPAPPTVGLDGAAAALNESAQGVTGAVTNSIAGISYLTSLQLNPLAKTGTDPLANGVATQIADFKPISTELITGPLAQGGGLKDLPLVGGVVKMLPL